MVFLMAAEWVMMSKGRRTLEMVFLTKADGMVMIMTNKQGVTDNSHRGRCYPDF